MQYLSAPYKKWPVNNTNSLLLFSFIAFGIGFAGYLLLYRGSLFYYAFAHVGALGALGLFGSAVGYIAMKKKRSFYRAFFLTGILTILSGVIAVLIAGDTMTCGGGVSLVVAVLILIASIFLKEKKTIDNQS